MAHTWGNGFLPAAYQGTLLRNEGTPILNLDSARGVGSKRQRGELDQLKKLNQRYSDRFPHATDLGLGSNPMNSLIVCNPPHLS